ncbi:MAG: N-acetyl-gamma-glutamyl-phosphate reductase [Anaerovorax sp.]
MLYKVFIDGQEGTTGLKIFERFEKRQDIQMLRIDGQYRKSLDHRLDMIEKADITFLCLPDAASLEIIKHAPAHARILDTSTAHRTNPDWVYGFPELQEGQRERIGKANRVAVPGCHATGFISLVKPLIAMDIAEKEYPFTCYSVTGYSGGGKKMIKDYEDDFVVGGRNPIHGMETELSSPRQYGLTQWHKHLPEMKAMTGIAYDPVFNPIVSNYYSGMLVSVQLHTRLLKKKRNPQQLRETFQEYYHNQLLVKVRTEEETPESGFIGSNNLGGSNEMELFIVGNEERITLMSRFDNLGKGASGAAIQCMNIMLGLPEDTGLQKE